MKGLQTFNGNYPFHIKFIFFFQNKLYPASVVHFGSQEQQGKKLSAAERCTAIFYNTERESS